MKFWEPSITTAFDVDTMLSQISEQPSSDPEAREDLRLGSGVIRRVIGEGGMAIVYEIWNEALSVKRAVKVLRPGSSTEHRDRFETEIKLSAQLDHPNIVRIHSVGHWNRMPYIEMELVEGVSLADLIKDSGALPLNVALSIALIVSRALCYTHTLEYSVFGKTGVGILHRDLKPENILISKKGAVKLTDFGIATPIHVSMHTPNGSIVGSLQYMAPEQLRDLDVDHRSDIFSFGCVLYEAITGLKAFPQRNIALLSKTRLHHKFEPLTTFKIDAPKKLLDLIRQTLEVSATRRPDNMALVASELGKIHTLLFSKSPEGIVEEFIRKENKTVRILAIRRKPLLKAMLTALSVVIGGFSVLSAGYWAIINLSH